MRQLGTLGGALSAALLACLTGLAVLAPAPAFGAEAFERRDVRLPGRLIDAAVVRLADGSARLAVLVAEPKPLREPRSSLLLIDVRNGRVTRLSSDLATGARRLAAVARPGSADLVVVSAGDGEPVVIDTDGGTPASLAPTFGAGSTSWVVGRGLGAGGVRHLAAVRPGHLLLATASGDGTALAAAGSLALPRQAERKGWGLRITSPPVHPVPGGCWAAGPVAAGPRRLRTLLYCAGEEEPLETWSLLPRAETVRQAHLLRHAGRPVLAVLTSQQTGLFVKQALRVFPLEASRNRVGTEPLLAADTGCPMWRGSSLGLADADGDGRDDLVLVCEQGLVDPELRVEVYPGEDGGGFAPRARDAKLDGAYGSWHFGDDWTGDGLPDLAAVRDEALHVHAGRARRRPIDRRPASVVEIAATDGDGPAFDVVVDPDAEGDGGFSIEHGGTHILGAADLTGDGRPELVLHRQGETEGTITILSPS